MEGIELKVGKLSSQSAAIHETHNTFPFLRKVQFHCHATEKGNLVYLFQRCKTKVFCSSLDFSLKSIKE